VAFGVLITETTQQVIERADNTAGNKGSEAAVTAIEVPTLLRQPHEQC
jgi:6,7-dimethyl-8-ribityllumazine synthase